MIWCWMITYLYIIYIINTLYVINSTKNGSLFLIIYSLAYLIPLYTANKSLPSIFNVFIPYDGALPAIVSPLN